MSAEDTTTGSGGQTRPRRRNYLVSRRFQLRMAAWIAVDVFAACFLCGVVLINVIEPQVRAQLVNPRIAQSPMLTLLGFSFAFAAIAAALFSIWSVIVTHRICGPIGVVQRGLEQVGRGEIPRFRPLRSKDEFRDFYAAYWRMVHALRSRRQAHATSLREILAAAESAGESSDAAARSASERIVRAAHLMLDEMRRGEKDQAGLPATANRETVRASSTGARG